MQPFLRYESKKCGLTLQRHMTTGIIDSNTPKAVISLNRRLNFLIDVLSFLNHCLCERAETWERVWQRESKIRVLTRKAFQVCRFEVVMTCKCVQMSVHPPLKTRTEYVKLSEILGWCLSINSESFREVFYYVSCHPNLWTNMFSSIHLCSFVDKCVSLSRLILGQQNVVISVCHSEIHFWCINIFMKLIVTYN